MSRPRTSMHDVRLQLVLDRAWPLDQMLAFIAEWRRVENWLRARKRQYAKRRHVPPPMDRFEVVVRLDEIVDQIDSEESIEMKLIPGHRINSLPSYERAIIMGRIRKAIWLGARAAHALKYNTRNKEDSDARP